MQAFGLEPLEHEGVDGLLDPVAVREFRALAAAAGGTNAQCFAYSPPSSIQRFRIAIWSGVSVRLEKRAASAWPVARQ